MAFITDIRKNHVNGVWILGNFAIEAKNVKELNNIFADIREANSPVQPIEIDIINVIKMDNHSIPVEINGILENAKGEIEAKSEGTRHYNSVTFNGAIKFNVPPISKTEDRFVVIYQINRRTE